MLEHSGKSRVESLHIVMGGEKIKVSRLLIGVAVIGATLALGVPAVRADLTVNSWDLRVEARDGNGAGTSVNDSTVSNTFNETRTAIHGTSSSSTIYSFNWGATGGSFDWDFDHQRAVAVDSFAQSTVSSINFTVTGAPMLYDLSGAYSMFDDQRISGSVSLFDRTAGSPTPSLFTWVQESMFSPNESFVVGQGGDGDFTDVLFGDLSGMLLAEHTYELSYNFFIRAHTLDDSPATADGNLHFTINALPVPTPSAALLAMMGLPLVAWFKRRFA